MTTIIVDTGPLVSYAIRRDRWHDWVAKQMAALSPPLVTCEAVLSEACFLIRRFGGNAADVTRSVVVGAIEIGFDLKSDASSVEALMRRYADTPMSLADACLVRLSERIPDCLVFTLDSDFAHYRRNGRQTIPLLRPV